MQWKPRSRLCFSLLELAILWASCVISAVSTQPALRRIQEHRFSVQEPSSLVSLPFLFSSEDAEAARESAMIQLSNAEASEPLLGKSLKRDKALLSNLPKRLSALGDEHQELDKTSRQKVGLQLPSCSISRDALGPELGGGTYGAVHSVNALATASCLRNLEKDTKLGVKIFRLRQIESYFRGALEQSKPSVITDQAVKIIRNELKQIDFSEDLYVRSLTRLNKSAPLEELKALVKDSGRQDVETYVRLLPDIRDAINTKCFLDELAEVGMVLAQVARHIRDIDPNAENEKEASQLSIRGLNEFLWSLPIAIVLIPDLTGRAKWGLLMMLFEGDMELKADPEALDGLASTSKTAALKPFLKDATTLMNLSAKAVRPFVFMHNVFRFGHFDVKPANLLFIRKEANRPGGQSLKIAAGDLGMAALLGTKALLRGTAAFMAPEMERKKGPSEVPASGTGPSFLWLDRCVKPNLTPGVEFSFKTMASTKGNPIFTPKVISEIDKCFAVGGGVERAYVHPAPSSVVSVMAAMVRTDPRVRVSMRHAFEVLKVTELLSRVAFGSSSEKSDAKGTRADKAKEKLINGRRSSPILALIGFNAASPEDVSEAACLNFLQKLLKILKGEFLREAASAAVKELPSLSEALQFTEFPSVSSSEEGAALSHLQKRLALLSPQFEYLSVIDSAFGVDEEGLRLLIQEAIRDYKLARSAYTRMKRLAELDLEIHLLPEQLGESAVSEMLKGLGVAVARSSAERETADEAKASYTSAEVSLLEFLQRRTAEAYALWTRVESLLRLAASVCRSRSSGGRSLQTETDSESRDLHACILREAQNSAQRLFYGWPWDSLGETVFGFSSKESLANLTADLIPRVARHSWPLENRLELLHLQARRAARRLRESLKEKAAERMAASGQGTEAKASTAPARVLLGEEGPLWIWVNKMLDEMAADRFIPLPFDAQTARELAARVLVGEEEGLQGLKARVILAASEQEAVSASKEVLQEIKSETQSLDVESLTKAVASRLHVGVSALVEKAAKAGGLFPPTAKTRETLQRSIQEAIEADRERPSGFSIRLSFDGAFFLSPGGRRLTRLLTQRVEGVPQDALVKQLNSFFQSLLLESLSPTCRSYTAVAHIREKDAKHATFKPIDENIAVSAVDTERFQIRMKAVSRASDPMASPRNNCFLWSKALLSEMPLVFKPTPDTSQQLSEGAPGFSKVPPVSPVESDYSEESS